MELIEYLECLRQQDDLTYTLHVKPRKRYGKKFSITLGGLYGDIVKKWNKQ